MRVTSALGTAALLPVDVADLGASTELLPDPSSQQQPARQSTRSLLGLRTDMLLGSCDALWSFLLFFTAYFGLSEVRTRVHSCCSPLSPGAPVPSRVCEHEGLRTPFTHGRCWMTRDTVL